MVVRGEAGRAVALQQQGQVQFATLDVLGLGDRGVHGDEVAESHAVGLERHVLDRQEQRNHAAVAAEPGQEQRAARGRAVELQERAQALGQLDVAGDGNSGMRSGRHGPEL